MPGLLSVAGYLNTESAKHILRGNAMEEQLDHMNARNARVQARYDELIQAGKLQEALFRVVKEEVERAIQEVLAASVPASRA